MEKTRGFTLVELAIVLTIVGLIIGGILKGQELLYQARVTSTIAQVQSYQAATAAFREKYEGLPGDLSTAAARIPGCTAACTPAGALPATTPAATGAVGDGIVGTSNWGAAGWQSQSGAAPALLANLSGETVLFWTHLLLGDFITGVTHEALTGAPAEWSVTHPFAKAGGGFVAGYGDGTILPGAPAGSEGITGLAVAILGAPTAGGVAGLTAAGMQALHPTHAAQIDRKIDDGVTTGGYVKAFGAARCFGAGGTYAENVAAPDCGLIFRIQ